MNEKLLSKVVNKVEETAGYLRKCVARMTLDCRSSNMLAINSLFLSLERGDGDILAIVNGATFSKSC